MITTKKIREDYWEGSASCSNVKKRQKEWTQLWNMKLPPKIKIFCWRLALNSLPTGSVLKSRSMVDTAECRLCDAGEDTWDHALLNCTSSKCICAQLDEELIEVMDTLSFPDPKHWVFFVCSNFSQSDSIRILITCWAIWQARRKAIYDGIFQSPLSTMAMVNTLIDELEIVEGFQLKEKNQPQKLKSRHWIAPPSGQCKINTDAAVATMLTKEVLGLYVEMIKESS